MIKFNYKTLYKGSISYCSQKAWLYSASLKENIIFASTFEKERYNKVIEACCLLSDLDQFENQDRKIVMQGGVNFSGGQQKRINLARCAYKDADIYILDDPLGSIDNNVRTEIFKRLISNKNGLLKEKVIFKVMDIDSEVDLLWLQKKKTRFI